MVEEKFLLLIIIGEFQEFKLRRCFEKSFSPGIFIFTCFTPGDFQDCLISMADYGQDDHRETRFDVYP